MSLGDAFGLTDTPNFLPRYHGDDGDTRYPSPRDLRSLGAILIDLVLMIGSVIVSPLVLLALEAKTDLEIPRFFGYLMVLVPLVVIVGNMFLLRKWVHASVGKMVFGLVEIRGSDGGWPGWRDIFLGDGASRDGVPNIVRVRRCDVRGRDRESER
ncbi:hypothetical protein ACPESR_25710 [Nocardia testacea]|uniref:hypothetical protein n=1 Tax=Nocardia testacea TaxID=248551 RepID=UPI003C2E0D96